MQSLDCMHKILESWTGNQEYPRLHPMQCYAALVFRTILVIQDKDRAASHFISEQIPISMLHLSIAGFHAMIPERFILSAIQFRYIEW